jgi:OmpA-OmpF porin, OOP family
MTFSFATTGLYAERTGYDRDFAQAENDEEFYDEDDDESDEEKYKFQGFKREEFYAGFFGGYNHLTNSTTNYLDITTIPPQAIDADEQFDGGFVGSIFFGYHIQEDWRLELELGYRRNTLDDILIKNTGVKNGEDGEVDCEYGLLSIYYDIVMDLPVVPYFGAGIGIAHVHYRNSHAGNTLTQIDDTQMVFAYQYVLGVSYPLSKKTSIFADYRYFGTGDPEFSDVVGTKLEFSYINHTGNIGFRFNF